MIKKILIFILFFGFSFGQQVKKSNIEGTWKRNGSPIVYTFYSDNTGFQTLTTKEDGTNNYKFVWKFITSKKSLVQGNLFIDFGRSDSESYKFTILYSGFVSQLPNDHSIFSYPGLVREPWKGGDILMIESLTGVDLDNFDPQMFQIWEQQ